MTFTKNKNILFIILVVFFMLFFTTKVYAHEHSAECYGGTLHVCSGDEVNGGGCYTLTEKPCQGSVIYNPVGKGDLICSCGQNNGKYEKYVASCNACGNEWIAYKYDATTCSACGASLKKADETIALGSPCPIKVQRYEKTCGKTSGRYYNSRGEYLLPFCDKVVVSVTPKYPSQTSDNPDFTLIATYLDGHTSEVSPSYIGYVKGQTYSNSTIALSYAGTVTRVGNIGELNTSLILTTVTQPTVAPTPTPTLTPTIVPTTTPQPTPTKTPVENIAPTPTPIAKETTETVTPIVAKPNDNTNNQTTTNDTPVVTQPALPTVQIQTIDKNKETNDEKVQTSETKTNIEELEEDIDESKQENVAITQTNQDNGSEKKIGLVAMTMIFLSIFFSLVFIFILTLFLVRFFGNKKEKINQVHLNDYYGNGQDTINNMGNNIQPPYNGNNYQQGYGQGYNQNYDINGQYPNQYGQNNRPNNYR